MKTFVLYLYLLIVRLFLLFLNSLFYLQSFVDRFSYGIPFSLKSHSEIVASFHKNGSSFFFGHVIFRRPRRASTLLCLDTPPLVNTGLGGFSFRHSVTTKQHHLLCLNVVCVKIELFK